MSLMKGHHLAGVLALWIGGALNAWGVAASVPGYVTSSACRGCHDQQFAVWEQSHHAWAWREPTLANVLGDFNAAEFVHQGHSYRFDQSDGVYRVSEMTPDGSVQVYPVAYVAGISPLQQYLIETEPGRLQALDVAWDTEHRRWYHLYPAQSLDSDQGANWRGSYKNWNSRCAECHATGYVKNYDPRRDRYDSVQAEIGVGCEACHGPAEAHLAWSRAPQDFDPSAWEGVDQQGLLAQARFDAPGGGMETCAVCHSRREALTERTPLPGSSFSQHYALALIEDGLYYPDGQIRDEVYVYGSFMQSRMAASGVTCLECHDAHSYRLKRTGNALCTHCHSPEGNARFETLKAARYDAPEHHFHPAGSAGSQCVSCHMPATRYMGVDDRRDHRFGVPRPDLSAELGTPNPCTQCHRERDAAWASAELQRRFPSGRNGRAHFATLFSAASEARSQPIPAAANQAALRQFSLDRSQPALIRASAVARLRPEGPRWPDELAPLADDPSPWVRTALARVLRHDRSSSNEAWRLALLSDSDRSVRLEAVKGFLGQDPRALPESAQAALRRAVKELQASLRSKADFPESQLVLGGIALMLRNLDAAEQAFRRATELDPQLPDAWRMRARIKAVQGQPQAAQALLEEGRRHNPDHPLLRAPFEKQSR